jgi:hypothetical protein
MDDLLPNATGKPALGIAGRFGSRARGSHGLSVALLGPDGSGKTTLAKALQEQTANAFRGADYYHAAFGFLPRLNTIARWFLGRGQRDERPAPPPGTNHGGMIAPHPALKSLLYVAYYAIDYLVGGMAMKRATAQGRLVLLDRWFVDYFIQRAHRRASQRLLRAIARLLPKPDLIVFLVGDRDTLHARKPELTAEEIEFQCRRMADLARWLPNTLLLRTDRPLAESLAELQAEVCRRRGARQRCA